MTINNQSSLNDRIDSYIETLFCPAREELSFVFENMQRAGMPNWSVSAVEGKVLYLLVKMTGAKKILELGALGGYSTIWLARGLMPGAGGKVISLEYEPKHARVAQQNIQQAGVSDRAEIRQGAALDQMFSMKRNGETPFDMFFIDADKETYPAYLDAALDLARSGSLILTDNVLTGGSVLQPRDTADRIAADYNRKLAQHPRLETIVLPFMRGYVDGLAVSLVK